jgi:hypothetical protein
VVGVPSWCGLEAKKFEKGQYRIVGLRVLKIPFYFWKGEDIGGFHIPWLPESTLSQTASFTWTLRILKLKVLL